MCAIRCAFLHSDTNHKIGVPFRVPKEVHPKAVSSSVLKVVEWFHDKSAIQCAFLHFDTNPKIGVPFSVLIEVHSTAFVLLF